MRTYEWPTGKKPARKVYEHMGKVYRPEVIEDLKKDTYHVEHWIEDLDYMQMFKADYTRYHKMSKRDFEMYVELGCPVQRGDHPWSHYRLYEAYKKKPETFDDKINKAFKKATEKVKSAIRKTRNT